MYRVRNSMSADKGIRSTICWPCCSRCTRKNPPRIHSLMSSRFQPANATRSLTRNMGSVTCLVRWSLISRISKRRAAKPTAPGITSVGLISPWLMSCRIETTSACKRPLLIEMSCSPPSAQRGGGRRALQTVNQTFDIAAPKRTAHQCWEVIFGQRLQRTCFHQAIKHELGNTQAHTCLRLSQVLAASDANAFNHIPMQCDKTAVALHFDPPFQPPIFNGGYHQTGRGVEQARGPSSGIPALAFSQFQLVTTEKALQVAIKLIPQDLLNDIREKAVYVPVKLFLKDGKPAPESLMNSTAFALANASLDKAVNASWPVLQRRPGTPKQVT